MFNIVRIWGCVPCFLSFFPWGKPKWETLLALTSALTGLTDRGPPTAPLKGDEAQEFKVSMCVYQAPCATV